MFESISDVTNVCVEKEKMGANNTQGHKMSTDQPSESMTGQEQADLKNIA